MLAFGIEFYQVACNILDAFFRTFLHPLPRTCAECGETWRFTRIATTVFRNLIQRMDRYVGNIATLEHQTYHLLVGTFLPSPCRGRDRNTHQTAKLPDAVIHMHQVVAEFYLLQFLQRQRHLSRTGSIRPQTVLMETVENLMVGKKAQTKRLIDKSLMQCLIQGMERNLLAENVMQTLRLFRLIGQEADGITLRKKFFHQRLAEQIHILVKQRLRNDVKTDGCLWHSCRLMTELYASESCHFIGELYPREQCVLLVQRLQQLLMLHLGQFLQTLSCHLRREPFLTDTINRIVDIHKIF